MPADGRFGSGPSKVRTEALDDLAATGGSFMGTSHRKPTVKLVVERLQTGLSELFDLPDGYEVMLGNGGATGFWDALTFSFIENHSQHLSFGEFSSKFAAAVALAPHLSDPEIIVTDPGDHPVARAGASVDTYAFTHNETSTGVMMPLIRPDGAAGLVTVDATSGAGGLRWDPTQVDLYYFSPQKCFASDGGLYAAAASPAAIERIERVCASDRWIPATLNLWTSVTNSRQNQTYNTPALATIFLTMHMVEWINNNGGIDFAAGRSDASADHIYGWADAHPIAEPFVTDHAKRSRVVATIDLDDRVDASTVSAVLRSNGILDTEGYRKLGRNQLRLAMFPGIDPDDTRALTTCIDHVIEALVD